ncbi:hypothetical protein PQX77_019716, partial [Marasmius sp. AFHP31]
RKLDEVSPPPSFPTTRSRSAKGRKTSRLPAADQGAQSAEEEEAEGEDEEEPPQKKARQSSQGTSFAAPGPLSRRRNVQAQSRSKSRPVFSPPPSPPHTPADIQSKPLSGLLSNNHNPPALYPSLPGTNHVDSRNIGFWDGPTSYGLTRDLAGVDNGVQRKVRGNLRAPTQLDINVREVSNALSPMLLRTLDNYVPCCTNCVHNPDQCIPCPHTEEKPSRSRKCQPCQILKISCSFALGATETDQLKNLYATLGDSSEAGIGRQMGEIAEGRRIVENLVRSRDSLNEQINHLASLDAGRVSRLRASCRDPRDVLQVLMRNEPNVLKR